MKREDIIRDIHGLDTELAALEEQYGLLSADFYHFYRAGELEQTRDFIRWAGFYETKLERQRTESCICAGFDAPFLYETTGADYRGARQMRRTALHPGQADPRHGHS
jgi:hypothetical protein